MPKLTEIAADMKQEAARRGAATRNLSRGLELTLRIELDMMRLTLSRPVTVPSEKEIAICRAAFGVPAMAERRDYPGSVVLRWPTT